MAGAVTNDGTTRDAADRVATAGFRPDLVAVSVDRLGRALARPDRLSETAGTAKAAGVYQPKIGDLRNSVRVGSFSESGIGTAAGGLDYSVITLTPDATTGLGQPLVRGFGGSPLTITSTAVPVAGAPVCKSGQTSGYTCGTVEAVAAKVTLAGDGGAVWSVNGFLDSASGFGSLGSSG